LAEGSAVEANEFVKGEKGIRGIESGGRKTKKGGTTK